MPGVRIFAKKLFATFNSLMAATPFLPRETTICHLLQIGRKPEIQYHLMPAHSHYLPFGYTGGIVDAGLFVLKE
jgi:hypothetical protein